MLIDSEKLKEIVMAKKVNTKFPVHLMGLAFLEACIEELEKQPKTNGDYIRSITNEELAKSDLFDCCMFCECCSYTSCYQCKLDYLNKEVGK